MLQNAAVTDGGGLGPAAGAGAVPSAALQSHNHPTLNLRNQQRKHLRSRTCGLGHLQSQKLSTHIMQMQLGEDVHHIWQVYDLPWS